MRCCNERPRLKAASVGYLIPLAQTALALASISRDTSGAAMCRPEIACVSYWEWARLIVLSVVMSVAITATAGAALWLILK
jgi:hypothetical protein